MEEEKFRMCLFNGTNFGSWKFRLEAILDQYDIKKFLEQDLDTLLEGKNQEQAARLRIQEKKCRAMIINHIADDQLEYIKDKKTPKDIYDTLKSVFERKTISSQLFTRKKLLLLKYNETEEMSQFLLGFDKIIRELKESGARVEECDAICHLLLTLPKSFEAVVAALETIDQSKLSLEFVKARLLDVGNKRKNNEGSMPSNRQVNSFVAQKSEGNFKCYNCGRYGHKRSQCRSRQNFNGDGQTSQRQHFNQRHYVGKFVQPSKDAGNQFHASSSGRYRQSNVCKVEEEEEKELCFGVGDLPELKHSGQNVRWLLDSGASEHMVNNQDYFYELKSLEKPINIAVAKKDACVLATKKGNVKIECNNRIINVAGVLYVPNLKYNLLSVGKLQEKGFIVTFKDERAIISRQNEVIMEVNRNGKLYVVNVPYLIKTKFDRNVSVATSEKSNLMLWHCRFGHVNQNTLLSLFDNNIVDGLPKIDNNELDFCEACVMGKQSRLPYPTSQKHRSQRPLELIHSHVCGPINPATFDGYRYFCTFIDDYTHFVMVYLMVNKSEVFKYFKQYKEAAETHFQTKISRVRVDNGGEYSSNEFITFCEEKGIKLEYTVPYCPEQNGVSERVNRSLIEKARSMIAGSSVPKTLWGEAVRTAAFIMNRLPSSSK